MDRVTLSSKPSFHGICNTSPPHPIGEELAVALLRDHYGLEGATTPLTSERDENFRIEPASGAGLVLKVFGCAQPPGEAELLAAILTHLERNAPDLPVPRMIRSRNDTDVVSFIDDRGNRRHAVVYSFLPGKPLIDARRSSAQPRQCGSLLARTAIALKEFVHPGMYRPLMWDLRHLPCLRDVLHEIDELPFAGFIRDFLDEFDAHVAERLAQRPRQFVHNDFNARNIIVDAQDESRIAGIIDFGDAVHTARIADVAVGVIGQLSVPETADDAMTAFVEAYREVSALEAEEIELVPWLVAGRIVQNVVITSWYRSRNPADEHFAAFGPDFFAWRVEFAKQLRSSAKRSSSPDIRALKNRS